eukprot:TRINITY_DN752_c0_g1_i13.p4 TRINITY_DN752_c0_g1~~TRINITY_DN752_c0_g1_i13.p4  ORF type:complete len:398 (+),score=38.05 TRINITY_DN752_c0_g1_i13:3470-4663(+)
MTGDPEFVFVGGDLQDNCIAFNVMSSHQLRYFQDKCLLYETCRKDDAAPAEVLLDHHVAYACRKGSKPGPNQDNLCCLLMKNPEKGQLELLLGVFDGHGPNGHIISGMAQKLFPKVSSVPYPQLLLSNEQYPSDIELALKETFLKVESAIESASEKAECRDLIKMSGTTATVAALTEDKLYIAYVGDSRAMYCSFAVYQALENLSNIQTDEGSEDETEKHSLKTTQDHNPNRPDERARIESCGGVVRQLTENLPFRVYGEGDRHKPGLAMSRAIGDIEAQKWGVLYEPELKVIEMNRAKSSLSKVAEYLVIASDGVWEVMTNEEILQEIKVGSAIGEKTIAEGIAQKAIQKWLIINKMMTDDITIVVHRIRQRQGSIVIMYQQSNTFIYKNAAILLI